MKPLSEIAGVCCVFVGLAAVLYGLLVLGAYAWERFVQKGK